MNRAWFIVWAIAICTIGAWAFAPADKPVATPAGDGMAFGENEKYAVDARLAQRKGAMAALDLAWSSRCGEDRKRFISGINEYYYHRQNQTERYPEIHGKLGADYIVTAWSTADDKRIDRLTQEAYARGYLTLSDFDGVARKMVDAVVKGERVTAKGCAG
jgi:hypothetical protein